MSSSSSASRSSRMATGGVMYLNGVYFPNHRISQGDTPGLLNYGCISHVYYAFASVDADGSVFLSDEWADMRAPVDGVHGGLGSLMHLKQSHPHLRVILSIGGGRSSEIFPIVAASSALRQNFAHSAHGLVEASGLDGIDIVWEYPLDTQQGLDLISLLAAVRDVLPENSYTLAIALPGSRSVLQNIDFRRITEYIDILNLMAYDFFGTWTHRTGHHAQLYALNKDEPSAAGAVQQIMAQGFPAHKILLGIPIYGRSFLHATGPGQKFRGGGGEDGTFEYNKLPKRGVKEGVDKRAVAAFSVGGEGGFLSYDNPETVKAKASFCKQKGLGGLFYWSGPADIRDPKKSLIATGFRTLHSS